MADVGIASGVSPRDTQSWAPGSDMQILGLKPAGAVPASTSTGGAVNLDNSSSTGAGIVVFSSRGSDQTGILVSIRNTDATFARNALKVDYAGTTHGIVFNRNGGSPTNGNLVVITSTNQADTTLGVSGSESGKGTVKITHNKPDGVADANASCVSLLLSRENAAETSNAQGIFADSDHALAAGSKLLNIRHNGTERFVVTIDAPKLPTYTTATKPAAATAGAGSIIFVSDGGAGAVFQGSTGAAWVNLG